MEEHAAAVGGTTTVCVTGAAGFIGSWLVMRLLERGYTVRGTVRDPSDMKKVKNLLEFPKASTNLTLWKADMAIEGSFDEAINGCDGVFHVATPMDFFSADPENEVIKPAIKGVLSIIRSCAKAKSVKRLIYTSSAGAINTVEKRKSVYDESDWSDLDFIYSTKMTGWMYFASKLLSEKAAWKSAEENKIDFISIVPTLVVGPFTIPTFPPSLHTAFALITGNEAQYSILKQCQFVHIDDLCEAHIYLYEHPYAEGRYICSSHDSTIYDVMKMLKDKWPEYHLPAEIKGVPKNIGKESFSSKKLIGIGFDYKYTLEEMYNGAIITCREEGLLPYSTQKDDNNPTRE